MLPPESDEPGKENRGMPCSEDALASASAFDKQKAAVMAMEDMSGTLTEPDVSLTLTRLLGALSPKKFEEEEAIEIIKGLLPEAHMIEVRHASVMRRIMATAWYGKSELFMRVLTRFLIAVAASQIYYVQPVMAAFAVRFRPSVDPDPKAAAGGAVDNQVVYRVAHEHLELLLAHVPMALNHLPQILQNCFPFFRRSAEEIHDYVANLLVLMERRPVLRAQLLQTIVEELMKIDTHVCREDIEAAEEEELAASTSAQGQETIFALETEDGAMETEQAKATADSQTSLITRHKDGHKLDLCMELMFRYIDQHCTRDSTQSNRQSASAATSSTSARMTALYREMLAVFEGSVLRIQQSNHVQFLLFYMASRHQSIAKHLLDRLWHFVQNPSQAYTLRASAAFYCGSLVARAKFVGIRDCSSRLGTWNAWIHQYIDSQDGNAGKSVCSNGRRLGAPVIGQPQPRQVAEEATAPITMIHGTFYAVCQSLFYVVAFRFHELVALPDGMLLLERFAFERIVKCQLNPLKYCAPNVTTNFANITRNSQLAYCYTIIERNRRQTLYSGTRIARESSLLLEPFFPFDPYLLKKSEHYIAPLYRHYCALDSDDAEMTDDVDARSTGDMSASPGRSLERSDSFREHMSYGISPGFKH
jgi:RNA polymerase I-specific transcription initiation factor RRN3